MADETLKPMQGGDITPPAADGGFEAKASVKDGAPSGGPDGGEGVSTPQGFADGAGKLQQQAFDKARLFVEDGKTKAGGALDQLAQMLTDAANTVDEKLGDQFGQYARTAAGTVSGFSEQVKAKDVDLLIDDARGYVGQSPAVAVGVAAAIGFVAARLIQSGFDAGKG